MQRRTPIYLICSPRPRVGGTLVARLLTEFIHGDGRPVAAFDVNYDDFPLADWLPLHTTISKIADTRGQIALFDELIDNDDTIKVVDIGAWSFERFFGLVHELGLIQEAHRRALLPVALFLADPHRRSAEAYADLQKRLPELVLVPVCNGAVIREQQARECFPAGQAGGIPVRITPLQPFLKTFIDRPGFSFDKFLRRPANAENELHAWIKSCFLEFRDLEMRLLLEEMKSTLQFVVDAPTTSPPFPSTSLLVGKRNAAEQHSPRKLRKQGRPVGTRSVSGEGP
jgi:hypothetical protein